MYTAMPMPTSSPTHHQGWEYTNKRKEDLLYLILMKAGGVLIWGWLSSKFWLSKFDFDFGK